MICMERFAATSLFMMLVFNLAGLLPDTANAFQGCSRNTEAKSEGQTILRYRIRDWDETTEQRERERLAGELKTFFAQAAPRKLMVEIGHEGIATITLFSTEPDTVAHMKRLARSVVPIEFAILANEYDHEDLIAAARKLPAKQKLIEFERTDNVDNILALKPGDVFLVDNTKVLNAGVTTGAAHLSLMAATPIYDEQTGEVFGVVGIEMNLERVLDELLEEIYIAEDVYVTDQHGVILLHHSRATGIDFRREGTGLTQLFPTLDPFFAEEHGLHTATQEGEYHAIRMQLGSRAAPLVFGLVVVHRHGA